MKNFTFDTIATAKNAGFIANPIEIYREFKIYTNDLGGAREFGYNFGLQIAPISYNFPIKSDYYFKIFTQTTTIWLTNELNLLKKRGCFWVAFEPHSLKSGIAAAKNFIDDIYLSNPAAKNFEDLQIEKRAQSAKKQKIQTQSYALKLAKKYGAENITNPEYKKCLLEIGVL